MTLNDAPEEDIALSDFLNTLYTKYHYDFRDYAQASLKRRLVQACEHYECDSFSMLRDLVLKDTDCLQGLLSYMTVQVSEMFRDPGYYKSLRENVIPHLRTYPSLKVWVAGCSSGEELYSLAILFREEGLDDRTIFYATDINTQALQKAQSGIFRRDRIPQFTKNYRLSGGKASLSDYYTAAYNGVIFDKSLRKNAVFSDHSLATDSVFAEVQFVSCRNVMIYFDQPLQNKAVGLFREALCPSGFLGLGSKESLRFSAHYSAFDEIDKQQKIYQKNTYGT